MGFFDEGHHLTLGVAILIIVAVAIFAPLYVSQHGCHWQTDHLTSTVTDKTVRDYTTFIWIQSGNSGFLMPIYHHEPTLYLQDGSSHIVSDSDYAQTQPGTDFAYTNTYYACRS